MKKKKMILDLLSMVFVMTLFLGSSTYAIYRGFISIGGTLASSEWHVYLNQQNVEDHLSIVQGGATDTYTLRIVSESEVDVVYSIIISNLPAGVSVSLDNDTPIPQSNNQVIISNAGTILYQNSEHTKIHHLTFVAAADATLATSQQVNIDVVARQYL